MSSINTATTHSHPAMRGPYFFLSYAHPPPSLQQTRPDRRTYTDPWVRTLFRDLNEEVAQRSSTSPAPQPGFIDQDLPIGSDWNALLTRALSTAEVFVPLYSPSYFNNSWSMRERAAFRQRLANLRTASTSSHVAPVLWTPFPPWEETTDVRTAQALGRDIPEYTANGLRALCMLVYYHEQYRAIVERLAAKIVDVAENSPLHPSPAPAPDEVSAPRTEPAFVAAVLAPQRPAGVPDLSQATVYGDTATAWRPYAELQTLPAAAYVASTAERLGLPTTIKDFGAASDLLSRHPAVLLIDPWMLDQPRGEEEVMAAAKSLQPWVVPLIVLDDSAPGAERGAQLATTVEAMLIRVGMAKPERVGELQDFVDVMPTLVTEARRQFLKRGPISAPPGSPRPRRRLSDSDG